LETLLELVGALIEELGIEVHENLEGVVNQAVDGSDCSRKEQTEDEEG
jgi:hypothetical protein